MASKAVYNYLEISNRPYSASDITLNLQNEFTKAVVQKALDGLVVNNQIYEKLYGKQKVYCIKQEDDSLEPEDLTQLDEEIKERLRELESVERQWKESEDNFKQLNTHRSTEEIITNNNELSEENLFLSGKLAKLENGGRIVSAEEMAEAKQRVATASRKLRCAKRATLDIVDSILEGYNKSKSELFDEIGIEPDL